MNKYKVIVNGTPYEVVVEAIDENQVDTASAASAASTQAPSTPAAPAKSVSGGESVKSPMPGNIISVSVKEGQPVKKGAILVVLEAMKMENEILAPCDGVVSNLVTKGSSVETGSLICNLL